MDSLEDLLEKSIDLDFIINSFILLSQAVRTSNQEGIIFPDLANPSNILYDPKNKIIKFIDFDGLQIGDCDSYSIANLMSNFSNPVFERRKYLNRDTGIYTPEFDKASLLTLFLSLTTHTVLTNFKAANFEFVNGDIALKKESLDKYITYVGLNDSPLEEDIRLIYDNDSHNRYPLKALKKLRNTHGLDWFHLTFYKK